MTSNLSENLSGRPSRILVTGASGLVGRTLVSHLARTHQDLLTPRHTECDFENRESTFAYFEKHKPTHVFHLAAKVGGIKANMSDPVGFLHANTLISCHVFEACHKFSVQKTLLLGSSCIYPRECPQPMREDYLLTGPLEPTNEGYALAKIVALKLAKYYHDQYGMNVVCPMPSNIYGPGDTFDLEKSHVLSALVRRFIDARDEKLATVTLWGTGSARREFVHVDDVARAMIFFMEKIETPNILNVGPGTDVSIKELAEIIASLVGYKGAVAWDSTRPDGMPRKCLDVTRLTGLGFTTAIDLQDGIRGVIAEYESQKRKTS